MHRYINRIALILLCFSLSASLLAQGNKLTVYQEKTENGYIFYADNNAVVPYSIQLNFKELKNLKPNKDLSKYIAVAPATTQKHEILRLNKVKEASTSYDFNYLFTIGDPNLKVDDEYAYWFPFAHGNKERVGQGYNGAGTHKGINAVDFNLNTGEAVHAARSGVVIDVKEDSNTGGSDPKFEKDGNFIRIYHADGTIADYVHLVQNGSMVKIGGKVKAGDKIGTSGNTGWSSGPHLHFMVSYSKNFQSISLPVKFLQYDGSKVIPVQGGNYYAFHEGKAKFEVETKEGFDEKLLETKLEKSSKSNDIEFTSSNYDDYVLIYVDNGFTKATKGKLIITLRNMESTKRLPHDFNVPAKTKMYLLALKPKDASKEFGYQLSAEFTQ